MIDVHADDYALTLQTSRRMLSLMKQGGLDSISIVPNTSCYEECLELLKDSIPSLPFLPRMSVHLNLVEGLSLAAGEETDGSSFDLIAGKSVSGKLLIATAWKDLFFASCIPSRRKRIKNQLKAELTKQVNRVWASIRECQEIAEKNRISFDQTGLRIDSHQHTHMIPVVREALFEVLKEIGYPVEYVRNSREPLIPFLSEGLKHRINGRLLLFSYRPVNLIKNRLLFFYSGGIDRNDKENGRKKMLLWGLLMSGGMDIERVRILLQPLSEYAEKRGRTLEILFHPGRMTKEEMSEEIPKEAAETFYLREERDLEFQSVIRLKELL